MADKTQIIDVLLETARSWSSLGTCRRMKVGAVAATQDGVILSSGYNGTASGLPHCQHPCDCGHEWSEDPNQFHLGGCTFKQSCLQAVHAEANVIARAARQGTSLRSAIIVATHSTCVGCASLLIQAGISEFWYKTPYRDKTGLDILEQGGVLTNHIRPPKLVKVGDTFVFEEQD